MEITTIQLWATFIAFLFFYALLLKTKRKLMILYVIASSLGFFYLSNRWLMLLLPATAIVSWILTEWMSKAEGSKRKCMLFLIVVLDLLPLLFFKYSYSFSELLNRMLATNFSLPSIAMPIGISFYTFQAISYSVDVYRRDFRLKGFLEYPFYLSFFPLLLSGPITRAETLFPQIRRERVISERLLYLGLWLFMLGIIKKAVVADYIAQYNDWIFSMPDAYSGFECLMGLIGFSMQIYLDFSGYSDISIGIAAMLGIRLRDYLYIPLGGNRHGMFRTCCNLFVTMMAAGIWHGSTLMFLFWGALHGIGLAIHKIFQPFLRDIRDNWLTISVSRFITLSFLLLSWVFFRSPDLYTAQLLLSSIFTNMDLSYAVPFFSARTTWCLLLAGSIMSLFIGERLYRHAEAKFIHWPWLMKLVAFLLVVQMVIELHISDILPFLYFRF